MATLDHVLRSGRTNTGKELSQYLITEIESYFKIDNKWVTDDLARALYQELKAWEVGRGRPYPGNIKIGYFSITIHTAYKGKWKFEVILNWTYCIEDKSDWNAHLASHRFVYDIKNEKFPVTKQGLIDMIYFVRECKAAADRGFCKCGEPAKDRIKLPNADMCAKCFVQRMIQ